MTDTSHVSLVLRWTPTDFSIVGSLVIISEDDALLLHQRHAEIPFHSFRRMLSPVSGGWYTCPQCNTSVRHGTGHEQTCRNRREGAPLSSAPSGILNKPSNPVERHLSRRRNVYSARPSHWPPKTLQAPSVGESEEYKSSLKRLNWSESDLEKMERKLVAQAWEDVPAGDPLKVGKIAKALVLEKIQKLPRPLRNLLLHRFEKKKWMQLSYFK